MAIPTQTSIFGRVIPNSSKNIVSNRSNKDTGFKYPILDDGGKYLTKSSGIELIKSQVKNLIKTIRGERFMLPNFGCNLKRFLMEPVDDALFDEIKSDIEISVTKYLSKLQLNKIQVFSSGDGNVVNVKLFLSVKETTTSVVVDIEI